MLIPRALKFVSFARIEDHFRAGWIAMIPNAPHHHQSYGIEMGWLCGCKVPGGFQVEEDTQTEVDEHERA